MCAVSCAGRAQGEGLDRYIFSDRLRRRHARILGLLVTFLVLVAAGVVFYRGGDRPAAQLLVRRSLVESFGTRGPLVAAKDQRAVEVGDTIRTDDVGQAQVAYFDGSVTRVDSGTAFKVIDLKDERDRKTIAGKLTGGRIANTVQALEHPQDRFEIRLPHAWVTSRGAANIIDCRAETACTIIGLTDVTEVTVDGGKPQLVEEGECLRVDAKGKSAPCPYPKRALCNDEFTLASLEQSGVVSQCAASGEPATPAPSGPVPTVPPVPVPKDAASLAPGKG